MRGSHHRVACLPLLLAASCAAEPPCDPPASHWLGTAPADAHTITVDRHDRIFWNGEIMSQQRLRNPLAQADAEGRTVKLVSAPGARCAMIEVVRLAMERSLSCRAGGCVEVAPAQ